MLRLAGRVIRCPSSSASGRTSRRELNTTNGRCGKRRASRGVLASESAICPNPGAHSVALLPLAPNSFPKLTFINQ
jgi:hypothetical protein